jgi:hypothetical protein
MEAISKPPMVRSPCFVFEIPATPDAPTGPLAERQGRLAATPAYNCQHGTEGDFELLVWGDVYRGETRLGWLEVARSLARSSLATAVTDWDGSFFVLCLDHKAKTAMAVSDITASRKVFFLADRRGLRMSDSPAGLGPLDGEVDPAGLAEYLLNGCAVGLRTVYSGVRLFPAASVASLSASGAHFSQYWSFQPDDALEGRPKTTLVRELADLLDAAIRNRARRIPAPVLISLSGGYDSTCLLGSLLRVRGADEIVAFSYAHDPRQTRTDAAVARETCARLGVRHETVAMPSLCASELVRRNAAQGFAAANLCSEIGVWDGLTQRLRLSEPRPYCLFGDNAFGHDPNYRLETTDEILRWLPLAGTSAFASIGELIPPERRAACRTAYAEACRETLDQAAKVGDVHRRRDFLYFSHRVVNVLLPWRNFFCAVSVEPVEPLLDKSLLDYFQHLPYSARRARTLYKKAVRFLHPEMLSRRRAVFYGCEVNLLALLQADAAAVAARLRDLPRPLQEWLAADALVHLLARIRSGSPPHESALRSFLKVCLKGRAATELWRRFRAPRPFRPGLAEVLIRAAVVGDALHVVTQKREQVPAKS